MTNHLNTAADPKLGREGAGTERNMKSRPRRQPSVAIFCFSKKYLEDVSSFCGPLIPLSGLLVMSALGFKARVDPFWCAFLHE